MGCVENITYEKFPKQSEFMAVGERVEVCYHYDTSKTHKGTIVRNDSEEPFETIIQLDNGRYLRGVECQFSKIPEKTEKLKAIECFGKYIVDDKVCMRAAISQPGSCKYAEECAKQYERNIDKCNQK